MFKKLNQYDIDTIINKKVIVRCPISKVQEMVYVGYLIGAELNNNNCKIILVNDATEVLSISLDYYPDIKIDDNDEFTEFNMASLVNQLGQISEPTGFKMEYNPSSFLDKQVYIKYKAALDTLDTTIGLVDSINDLTVDNVLDIINIVGIENISNELKNILTA